MYKASDLLQGRRGVMRSGSGREWEGKRNGARSGGSTREGGEVKWTGSSDEQMPACLDTSDKRTAWDAQWY